MLEKDFLKVPYTTETAMCIFGLLVASWACEVIVILTQKKLPHCFFV